MVDLLPYYIGKKSETLWVSRTDHHPNREGHRTAAVAAVDFIIKKGILKHAGRDLEPGATASAENKTISPYKVDSMAKDLLHRGDPDAALLLVAQAL